MLETAKDYLYEAFGFRLSCEIPFPELNLLPLRKERPDIEVSLADLSEFRSRLAEANKRFIVDPKQVVFQVADTATFRIVDGHKIFVSPMLGADIDKIRLYILGTCMGAILMQRKILPLHGSAIAIEGKAYAFIGDSGAGKSTLASVFLNSGCRLLSDDVIAVSLSGEQRIPLVTPSYPQQKLWRESMDVFGMQVGDYRPLFERENKYAIPVSNYSNDSMPLAGLFELERTNRDHVKLQPMQKLERLPMLYRHTYRNFLVSRMGLASWHFDVTAAIAGNVDCFQVSRPDNGFTAEHLSSLILEAIHKKG